jgi:hypothetical protein
MADDTDIFAEAERRYRALFEQFATASISDVLAVVDATGPGAGRLGGEGLWNMSFRSNAWRVDGGEIQTRPLTLCRRVTDEELKSWQELIEPYDVIRVKARVVVDSAFGSPQALLEAFVGSESSDAELRHYAEELQRPVTFDDPLLGTFTLDRRVDWFTGDVVWAGEVIALHLSGSADAQGALRAAYALWRNQTDWNQRVRDFAAEKLLELKNDTWLDEGDVELTAEEFMEKMTLKSITVNPDGSFDFWHDDGDLFWGHSIQISGNLVEGPTRADIPG